VAPGTVLFTAIGMIVFAIITALTQHAQNLPMEAFYIVLAGAAISILYTAGPLSFKRFGLGDLAIFLNFGPLLFAGISLATCGHLSNDVLYYSVPYGLLTVDILHINNERDIEIDTKGGVFTFARFLGRDLSYVYHCLLIIVSYAMVAYRGYMDDNYVLFITNLCIPWVTYVTKRFKAGLTFELP